MQLQNSTGSGHLVRQATLEFNKEEKEQLESAKEKIFKGEVINTTYMNTMTE